MQGAIVRGDLNSITVAVQNGKKMPRQKNKNKKIKKKKKSPGYIKQ